MGFLSRVVADAAAPRADARPRVDERSPELAGGARPDAIEVVLDAPTPEAPARARSHAEPDAAAPEPGLTDALPSLSVSRGEVDEIPAAAEPVSSAPAAQAAPLLPVQTSPARALDPDRSEESLAPHVDPANAPPVQRQRSA